MGAEFEGRGQEYGLQGEPRQSWRARKGRPPSMRARSIAREGESAKGHRSHVGQRKLTFGRFRAQQELDVSRTRAQGERVHRRQDVATPETLRDENHDATSTRRPVSGF